MNKFGYVMWGLATAALVVVVTATRAQDANGAAPKANAPKAAAPKAAAPKGAGGKPAPKGAAPQAAVQAAPGAQAAAGTGASTAAAGAPAGAPAGAAGILRNAMLPGQNHAHLKALVGSWNAAVKSWQFPNKPPTESKATAVFQLIMDGRFLVENFVGTTPQGDVTGMGLYGYDNVTGAFECVRIDTQGTGMARSTGEWKEEHGAFSFHGEFSNPLNGGPSKSHSTLKRVSDTEYLYEMYEMRADKLFKSVEITYTKA